MSAYLIADVEVLDPAAFAEYFENVPATVEAYGGRYLVRGGETDVLEGDCDPKRVVVLEFPDIASLRSWYSSPEYAPLLEIRLRAANTRIISVVGHEGP